MTSVNTNYHVATVSQPLSSAPARTPSDGNAPALLPSPDVGVGDPVAMLAKLMVKNAQDQRDKDSISADAEDKAEDAADARRIDAMKDKAQDTFMAGMASGLGQIGQGLCSFGAAGALSSAAADTPSASAQAADSVAGRTAAAQAKMADRTGEIGSKIWGGAGDAASGFGKVGEAGFKKGADAADVQATQADNEAKVAKRGSDALRKQEDAAAQDTQKIIQILQDIKNAQAQEEHAALVKM